MVADVINAYRYAEDACQISSYLLGNAPYSIYLVNITGAQRSVGQSGGLGSRTTTRIVVANMFGADGYITTGPPELDGYINPPVRDLKGDIPLLSGQAQAEMEWLISPLVFPYSLNGTNGGIDPAIFYPTSSTNAQILINIKGPGMNVANGQDFKIEEVVLTNGNNIWYSLRLISTGGTV